MTGSELVVMVAAGAAAAGALLRLAAGARARLAGLALLLAAWAALVGALLVPGRSAPATAVLAAAGAGAAVLAWLLAGRLQGREALLLAAGAAVLTVRLPVPLAGSTAMLLVPLYAVIGLGSVVLARSEHGAVRTGTGTTTRPRSRVLEAAIAAVPVLACLSLAWTIDVDDAARVLVSFLVPFLLLATVVAAWTAAGTSLRPAGLALLATAVAASAVGLYQAVTRQVWWNPKVIDANRFRPDFRTNSLFWDPNIYGRALVIAALLVVAWLLAGRAWQGRRGAVGAWTLLALFSVALWNTYSQSSWVALAAATAVIAVLTLPPMPRRWVAAAIVVALVAGSPLALRELSGPDATGRAQVVRAGIDLARERPLVGSGIGTFETAARAGAGAGDRHRLTASHTTPVTVAAELGVLGLAAYVFLLGAALAAALARWKASSAAAAAARAGGASDRTGWPAPATIWVTGALVALVAHSLLYAGFFEDPVTWVALALLAGLPRGAAEPSSAPAEPAGAPA